MQVTVDREETDDEVFDRLMDGARRRYFAGELTSAAFEAEASKVLDPDAHRRFRVNTKPAIWTTELRV